VKKCNSKKQRQISRFTFKKNRQQQKQRRFGWLSAFDPTLRKIAKDGAPGHLWSVEIGRVKYTPVVVEGYTE